MNDDTVHLPVAGDRHMDAVSAYPLTVNSRYGKGDEEWDRTADRDALLAMTPRQHMLAAAVIAVDTSADDVVLREIRTQTHLMWATVKMADDGVRRNG